MRYHPKSCKMYPLEFRNHRSKLSVHSVYTQLRPVIPEFQRIHFTRLRVISHDLRIETGRWARLPREQRLCSCGEIQSEKHVIESCDVTKVIRDRNSHMTFAIPHFFDKNENSDICKVVHDIALILKHNM